MLSKFLLPFVFLAGVCVAPDIHFGLKAGIPFTPYYKTGSEARLGGSAGYSAATRRYALGASFEWRLSRTPGLEIDTIYRRTGYVSISTVLGSTALTTSSFDVKGHSWDFPPRVPSIRAIHLTCASGFVQARSWPGVSNWGPGDCVYCRSFVTPAGIRTLRTAAACFG